MKLTKRHVVDALQKHKLMVIATTGEHPWIAPVYFAFDEMLHLYFLSSPDTLHCRQLSKNPKVAVAIFDSNQKPIAKKKGLQIYGLAKQIVDAPQVTRALDLWKKRLKNISPLYTYEQMVANRLSGRMFVVTPKKIKYFNQQLFKVEEGQEPVLEL